jgi:hypothetical protein
MKKIIANGQEYEQYDTIDFIDIGGSKGGSYKYIKEKYKFESGLAIDIDIRKVNESLKNNVPAIRLDATKMGIFKDNACKLISIMHVLEHLPNKKIIEDVLKESIRVSKMKIYITGPMYYKEYLSKLGFQFYWSHWRGHTYLIEPDEIIEIMKKLGITKYELNFKEKHRIHGSDNKAIQPIGCAIDRHGYDKSIDPPKDMNVIFKKPLYKEFELIFHL